MLDLRGDMGLCPSITFVTSTRTREHCPSPQTISSCLSGIRGRSYTGALPQSKFRLQLPRHWSMPDYGFTGVVC